MSLKFKLIIIVVGILVVIGLPAASFIYWQNSKILGTHANTDIKSYISHTRQLINFYIGGVENNLTSLANDPEILKALQTKSKTDLAQASQKMSIVSRTVASIENIGLFEIKGSTCLDVASNKAGQPVVGQDFSSRDYCKGIIKTGAAYLSSAYVGVIDGQPVLGQVVPVRDNSGTMLGFVYGSINLSYLRGYIWDLQENSKVELLDRYGVMFLNTEEKIEKLGVLSQDEKAEVDEILLNLANNKNEGIFQDEDNFVGYYFDGALTVVLEKSTTDLMSFAHSLNLIMALSLLVAIILSIIFISVSVGRITRSISHLSQITKDIANGKFDVKLNDKEVLANDETAVLARSFYDMAGRLTDVYNNLDQKVKERTEELEKSKMELSTSLDRSERTNRLMVGRELEMIRLKKEISELKNKKDENMV